MPKRTDLKTILIIGSGPIVIGQGCEFDYSGTQACKALKAEGLEVILVNSNPATIMTDPEIADRTYVEPLTPEILAAIIERERPDAVLPTVGGQTALNLAVTLGENGTLEKYGARLIGASVEAIKVAEDRLLFRNAMKEIDIEVPASGVAKTLDEALRLVDNTGFLDPGQLQDQFVALPIVITAWAGRPLNSGFFEMAAAAIVVMLVIVLLFNSAAIIMRNRFEKKRGTA